MQCHCLGSTEGPHEISASKPEVSMVMYFSPVMCSCIGTDTEEQKN